MKCLTQNLDIMYEKSHQVDEVGVRIGVNSAISRAETNHESMSLEIMKT